MTSMVPITSWLPPITEIGNPFAIGFAKVLKLPLIPNRSAYPSSGDTKTKFHIIHNHYDPIFITQLADMLHPAWFRYDSPQAPEDGLEGDGSNIAPFFPHRLFEHLKLVIRIGNILDY